MAESKSLKCVVVTPEKAVLDEPADFVVVPMIDGELGVALDRLPLIGRLGFGDLRISQGSDTKHFYVDGGFVQIRGNVVTVLTSKAMAAKDIKTADARGRAAIDQNGSDAGRAASARKGSAACPRPVADCPEECLRFRFPCILRTIRKHGLLRQSPDRFPIFSSRYGCCSPLNSSKMSAFPQKVDVPSGPSTILQASRR